jgi:hypothetical protein
MENPQDCAVNATGFPLPSAPLRISTKHQGQNSGVIGPVQKNCRNWSQIPIIFQGRYLVLKIQRGYWQEVMHTPLKIS